MKLLLSLFIKYLVLFLNIIFNLFSKKSFFRGFTYVKLRETFKNVKINNNLIKFYVPSSMVEWRVDTLFKKEPETLKWIDDFKNYNLKKKEIIFWDIGANIGLFSIYATCVHENIKVISFEPSVLNLNILARNISENCLNKKIIINQIPLTNKENSFLEMKESFIEEGASLSSFGEKFNHEGKEFKSKINYKVFGTTIDYFIENKILGVPNFVKIDVDGIEHLIIEKACKILENSELKSILIEINENFKEQKSKVENIMKKFNFILKEKIKSENMANIKSLANTFNYIYFKN